MDPITRLTALGAAGAGGADSYWIATLGGTDSEQGYGIAVDGLGNVYVGGRARTGSAGDNDYLIAKYDSSGVIQWQRFLGGTLADYGESIAVDGSGNVYITGYTQNAGAGSNDVLIAKYNSSGVIQWQRTLGGTGGDIGRGIAVDSSGYVYVAGYTNSAGAGGNDTLLAKYDSSGAIQWQKILGGTGQEQAWGMAVDGSSNSYIAGRCNSTGAGSYEALIAKYNSSGTIQWQRTLGGTLADFGISAAVDSSSNVYLAGYTETTGAGGFDYLIAKYDTSGTIQWQRTLGGTGSDFAQHIAADSAGNAYVIGYSNSATGDYNYQFAKYNSSGVIQWQRYLGTSSTDIGTRITVDNSGNVYITGYVGSGGAGGANDLLIAKLPGDGSLTGTYGSFTYAASSLTDAASSLTDAACSLTDTASSLTDAACSLTDAASSLTSSTTTL